MMWLSIIGLVVLFCFGFVLLFGAPYLPTLTPQVTIALNLLALKPGQTMLELGCGDGKVLVAAAQRGWKVVGYELNPLLFVVSWLRTRRYRKLVTVRLANFWSVKWPPTDAVFAFALAKYMTKLDKKLTEVAKGRPLKLVSFTFQIADKTPHAEQGGVYLYEYR